MLISIVKVYMIENMLLYNTRYILNVSERVRFKRVVDGPPIIMYHVPLSDYGDTPLSSVLEECFAVISMWIYCSVTEHPPNTF